MSMRDLYLKTPFVIMLEHHLFYVAVFKTQSCSQRSCQALDNANVYARAG